MSDKPLILDAEQTLRLPLAGVKLIEASAGTGKTYAISNLYLRYVLAGFQVSQILVVTFTNAATEELRGRIRKRLHEAQRALEQAQAENKIPEDDFLAAWLKDLAAGDGAQREAALSRLRYAVRSMEEAAIFTINGFCQRALTEHAFSSGQSFQLELTRDDDTLWQDALKDWWRRTVYPLSAEGLALFSSVFPSLSKLMEAQVVLRHAQDKRLVPKSTDSLDHIYAQWQSVQGDLLGLGVQWVADRERYSEILNTSKVLARNAKSGYRLAELTLSLQRLDTYFASGPWFAIPPALELLSAQYLQENSKPTQIGKDKALEDPFFTDCERVWNRVLQVRELLRMSAVQRATEQARVQMEEQKALSRTLTYHDQLSRLRDALAAPAGEDLAQVLRTNFPVAMIDEFQDTDDLQYEIFRRLYLPKQFGVELAEASADTLAMIMIGDPKQAIYSFRGGDIFAYAKARRDVGEQRYTLATNWRSVPELIDAVNQVFMCREAPFVYDDIIDFQPVQAADKTHKPLLIDGWQTPAFSFWQFGLEESTQGANKNTLEQRICDAVTDEIASLIVGGRSGTTLLGDKPVVSGDIAVLVRNGYEGVRVRQALQRRGVDAVTVGRDTVFESAEANALYMLLEAVVHYQDRSVLRAALSSDLLGLDYAVIAATVDSPNAWLEWAQQMRSLHSQWGQRGFMAMFYSLLQRLELAQRLAEQADSERRLTNLLHLGELLQQTSRGLPGFESLLSWFHEQLQDSEDDETQLRLESDEALVKIVTIHASKGLEYPIAFVPFLWASKPRQADQKLRHGLGFHNDLGESCLALDTEAIAGNLYAAEKERLAEDVRLVYVALTRARAKLYCVWGAAEGRSNPACSALAWLLNPLQTPAQLATSLPNAPLDAEIVSSALESLASQAGGNIQCQPLPISLVPVQARMSSDAAAQLQARSFNGSIANDWRISSFSSLTREVHQPPIARSVAQSDDAILQFTAGAQVGLFLHDMLEHMDFGADISEQAVVLNKRFAKKYGFVPEQQEQLIAMWMHNIVTTPLNDTGLNLASLGASKRLSELEFDLGINRVEVTELNRVIGTWAGRALDSLSIDDFRGMITGFIDLVFEHEGRFYIADYKSNLLGLHLSDYAPEALKKAMFDRRYDLQYLLYILALHRYLQQRVPHYHYDQHMGGAYYLFLRGMRPEQGPRYGVFFDLPPHSLIDELDQRIFGIYPQAESSR